MVEVRPSSALHAELTGDVVRGAMAHVDHLSTWRSPHDRAALTLALAVASALALTVLGRYWTNLSLDIYSIRSLLGLMALLAGVLVYCRYRQIRVFQPVIEVMLLFFALNIALLPISYIAVRFNLPIADAWLSQVDKAMGFDWKACVDLVDRSRFLSMALLLAYTSFGVQLFLLPGYFAVAGNASRAFATVFAYGLIVFVAAVISIWFPSEGALQHYGYTQSDFFNVNMHFATAFLDQFHLSRAEASMVMSLDTVQGLLTFPSVHAAASVLCAWAAWGSRYLRYPFLVLNFAMCASAISHGGHFAIDVLAGIVLAALAIAAAKHLFAGVDIKTSIINEAAFYQELKAKLRRTKKKPAFVAGE